MKGDRKPKTLRNINTQLNAVLNYAVKYYGLPRNPGTTAGVIGSTKSRRMDFWTHDEFKQFIAAVDNPRHLILFNILYYTGLRCGEALALTPADIDLEKGTISVAKTYHRMNGRDIVTSPKTPNSVRVVPIPPFLGEMIQGYMQRIYELQTTDRLIPLAYDAIHGPMRRACDKSGVKKIRVHDIRHSHVSLLIELGFSPMLIAERIGDTVQMVNNTYGHLYPNKHEEVAAKLQQLVS